MDHLLICPALTSEHVKLREGMKMKFTQWDIPFALIPLKSYEVETRINWRAAALKAFPSVSKSRVDILTKAYWKKHAQTICLHSTLSHDLTLAIENRYPMACVQLCHDLIALLTQILFCRCMDSPTS